MKAILWIVGIVAILGIGGFLLLGDQAEAPNEERKNMMEEEGSMMKNSTSLRGLMMSESSQRCTFSDTTEETTTNGVVYVANGKIRGDFTTTSNGTAMEGHMIGEGDTGYVWMEGQTTGFRASFSAMEGEASEDVRTVDPEKELDVDCEPWTADASVFVPPSGIEFMDVSEIQANMEAKIEAAMQMQTAQ